MIRKVIRQILTEARGWWTEPELPDSDFLGRMIVGTRLRVAHKEGSGTGQQRHFSFICTITHVMIQEKDWKVSDTLGDKYDLGLSSHGNWWLEDEIPTANSFFEKCTVEILDD